MADGKRGRLPKTAAERKRDVAPENYRPGKHGNPPISADGVPKKPRGFAKSNKMASDFWDQVVPQLIEMGHVNSIDTPQLVQMCEWYAIRCRLMRLATTGAAISIDVMKLQRAQKTFDDLAAKFGLSPKDRQRLREWTPKDQVDEFDEFDSIPLKIAEA